RKLLGLGEEASINQIKAAYRTLAKKYHPDTTQEAKEVAEETMRKLNDAFQTLMEYSLHFPLPFKKEEMRTLDPEELLYEQFKDDWLFS
ncbi:MAG: J domain-containing protein, partial [bacterium]